MPTEYPPRVVDVHAHIFNARHLPLKGVLKSKKVPAWLASLARDLFNQLTGKVDPTFGPEKRLASFAPATDELGLLADHLTRAASRQIAAGPSARAAMLPSGAAPTAGAVQSALSADPLYKVLERIEALALREQVLEPADHQLARAAEMAKSLRAVQKVGEAARMGAVGEQLFARFRDALRWFLGKLEHFLVDDAWGSAMDYLKFFILMLSDEKVLVDAVLAGYRPDQNAKLVLHLMMDMEMAFKEKPYYPFYKTQIQRLADVVESTAGRAVGFVAFDPRRPDGMEIVRYALGRGACGVKVYPPMGYTAYGDDADQKRRFEEVYGVCEGEGIPILTHCTAVGFERTTGDGPLANPTHWGKVLERHPNLVLDYGHAGGGGAERELRVGRERKKRKVVFPGWYSADPGVLNDPDPNNFACTVVEHCRRYPNVYCDFSYFTNILEHSPERAALASNLEAAFAAPIDDRHPYHFFDKAMYGSDWHMPSITRDQAEYLECWVDIFDSSPTLRPHKNAFFADNALRFLNLKRHLDWHQAAGTGRLSPATRAALSALVP